MSADPDCLFCKIVAGEIPADVVYEDELSLAFRDINPKAETHLLLIPKKHIATLNDLSAEEDALVAHLMRAIPKVAETQGVQAGYRTIANIGKDGGQVVFHLHFHILAGKGLPGFG